MVLPEEYEAQDSPRPEALRRGCFVEADCSGFFSVCLLFASMSRCAQVSHQPTAIGDWDFRTPCACGAPLRAHVPIPSGEPAYVELVLCHSDLLSRLPVPSASRP